jgi:hypothetical protein
MMVVVETADGSKVVTSNAYNALLVYDVARSTIGRHPFEGFWVARVLGKAGDAIVAEFFLDPGAKGPWFQLGLLDPLLPSPPRAWFQIEEDESHWKGDDELWQQLPPVHHRSIGAPAGKDVLVLLSDVPGVADVIDLPATPAFAEPEFGLVTATGPDRRRAILARRRVGREVVIYDLHAQAIVQTVDLPKSGLSYAMPRFLLDGREVWMSCVDELLRLDLSTGSVVGRLNVGSWRDDYITDIALDARERVCAVALFSSGAVLSVATDTFQVTHKAETAETLQEIVLLDEQRFVAKPWATETFIAGHLRDQPFSLPDLAGG